ncbi:MAG TPA: hypothetical protein VNA67_10840 [Pseudonocardiaceae bacterium]|nr:hypothetical protein [Pseudonocardiaceae bacterium]
MNMVIILEILGGIVVLAIAVRFAVRDARQRRGVAEEQDASEVRARGSERQAEQDPSAAVDQREGEEVAALSAPAATAPAAVPEPPADPR